MELSDIFLHRIVEEVLEGGLNMSCVYVTDHAKDRTRQRVGLPKRVIEKNAERAFEEGIKHSETSGSLKRFIDGLYLSKGKANNIRIYCGNVYLFVDRDLVTVISLPARYRKTVDDIWRKRRRLANDVRDI